MWFDEFKTPIGVLQVACDDSGLRFVMFENNKYDAPQRENWKRDTSVTREAREQLLQYFSGERKIFDLSLNPIGTEFQIQTWRMLAKIPFGETWSYGQVANKIGSPKAVRAVGAANGRNPIPIILPCHRVIGSNGTLTGFGGGLPTKQWLLEHEGFTCAHQTSLSF
jgi:methylated-DNA-[protein]-cysteine S-methyltransferase